ncbi:flotillin family protein [Desulfonema magnum]|uniref:Flotillin domain-containing protein n=1 Tax=Desulfonema magnum TaxID=45655 RepID=A0A975GP04_9BACT|nr:flotillin domain-containing protein [Desulfonema magnum]QTA88320.1 Flotillin domain-containing protein [Desulfonema magnum]
MSNFMIAALSIGFGLFTLIVIGLILSKLYARASKEVSFVRTGWRGQKVIMNAGALVFPVLHQVIPVNMNTLRLEVQRTNVQALITRDRMRVDVQAEFYVRVKPTVEAIANAAQTLGRRTMDPTALKELVEGKFVDALRAVAAEMAIEELHEQRVDFVQKVQTAVSEDLLKNGLELETVSLTALDQTDQSHFNAQNIFDARGLTKLTEEIEARRKQRNDIERDTEVEIQKKNLGAERQKLELSREEEYARLEQQREIEVRRAEQQSEIAREQAEKERQAKEAQIIAKQQVDQAQLMAERGVEEERIEKERLLREKDIERKKAIETAEIERKKSVTLADQERAIAIAEKSKEKSVAQAEADKALALSVTAEEKVSTARETEIAERQKAIELVEARKQAERDAIGIMVAADAEKKAAADKADALRVVAVGEADKIKIAAQAEAQAKVVQAEADKKRYAVEAEGTRALHEAENILEPGIIAMRIKISLIEHLDKIIRESVKPIQAIEGIKIIQVGGLGSAGGGSASGKQKGSENLADQMVNSALRYRGQAPLIDSLLKELGISSGCDINELTAGICSQTAESSDEGSDTDTD